MDLNGNGDHGVERRLGGDEEARAARRRRQAGAPDQGGRAEAGRRRVSSGRQAVQDGHGLSRIDAQLRAALLARRRRHPPGLLLDRPTSAGQIDADVLLSVTPPPQMPATLEAGTINGYAVGEPWNQQAVVKGIGVPVVTDYEIWKNNPEKVFGVTEAWADANPHTHVALDQGADPRRDVARRERQCEPRGPRSTMLAQARIRRRRRAVIANSMTGTFEYERGDKRAVPDFNVFFRYFATYPYYTRRGLVPHADAALGADR